MAWTVENKYIHYSWSSTSSCEILSGRVRSQLSTKLESFPAKQKHVGPLGYTKWDGLITMTNRADPKNLKIDQKTMPVSDGQHHHSP